MSFSFLEGGEAVRLLVRNRKLAAFIACAAFTAMAVPASHGYSTISWNSYLGVAGEPLNLTSTDELMDAGFVFELGVFDAGFVPDPARKWEWQAKWHAAQTKNYNAAAKSFSGSIFLTQKPVANPPPFTVGKKAYIWGKRGTPDNAEWILISNANWLWPLENDNSSPSPLNWFVTEANQIILGEVNANPGGTPFLMKSAAVSVKTWADFQTTALAGEPLNGPQDDPDHDGVVNLLEFAYVTDPLNKDEAYFPEVTRVEDNGQTYLSMSIERNQDHAVALTVQFSSDLVNWVDGPAASTVTENSAIFLTVRDNTPITPALPTRFVRLKATLP